MHEPHPDLSPLGVNFKILDEHPHFFYILVPPPPPPPPAYLRKKLSTFHFFCRCDLYYIFTHIKPVKCMPLTVPNIYVTVEIQLNIRNYFGMKVRPADCVFPENFYTDHSHRGSFGLTPAPLFFLHNSLGFGDPIPTEISVTLLRVKVWILSGTTHFIPYKADFFSDIFFSLKQTLKASFNNMYTSLGLLVLFVCLFVCFRTTRGFSSSSGDQGRQQKCKNLLAEPGGLVKFIVFLML